MKKFRNILVGVGIGLFPAGISLGNLYFYHFWIFDDLPKFFWIPFCLLTGSLIGLFFVFKKQKIEKSSIKINWLFLFAFSVFISTIVFSLRDLYYLQLKNNSFSEIKINIKAPKIENLEEVVINDIRIDQRSLKWQENCQVKEPYRWVRNQAITLENKSDGQGEIECRFSPIKSVDIVFEKDTLPVDFQITVNGLSQTYKVLPKEFGDYIRIDAASPIKELIPNVLLFLNIFFIIFIFCFLWIAAQTNVTDGEGNQNTIWIISGLLLCYVLFFINFTYFNDQNRMVLSEGISKMTPIGWDFNWIIIQVQTVIFNHQPLAGSYYSPGSFYYYIPFAFMDYSIAYRLYTIIKIAIFFFSVFMLPFLINSKTDRILPTLFLISGLFSYGFLFELERGQGYSLVFSLLFLSIWLFQKYYDNKIIRFFSYFLYTFTIQMKLTPVFFAIFFIRNWRDYKNNIIRLFTLGFINFLLVFSTGFSNAIAFINSILWISETSRPILSIQNHSVKSYILLVQSLMFDDISGFSNVLLSFVIVCVVLFLLRIIFNWRKNNNQIDPLLMIGFCLAALLIPNENHDYTLAILPIILSIGFCIENISSDSRLNGFDYGVISILYSITLFSDVLKPNLVFVQNNCLSLLCLIIYISVTVWKKEIIEIISMQFPFAKEKVNPNKLSEVN